MKVKNQYLKMLSARIQMFPYHNVGKFELNATNYNVNQALYFPPKKKKSWSSHEQICAWPELRLNDTDCTNHGLF